MNTKWISVPTEGRPTSETDPNSLVGVDGNAFAVMGHVQQALRRAGATKAFTDAYIADATSGDYDHLLAVSVAYLSVAPSVVDGWTEAENREAYGR